MLNLEKTRKEVLNLRKTEKLNALLSLLTLDELIDALAVAEQFVQANEERSPSVPRSFD